MERESHEPLETPPDWFVGRPLRATGRMRNGRGLQDTSMNGGISSTSHPPERPQRPPEPPNADRLQYLKAIFPYGAHEDLMNVILTTPDTDTAAQKAYSALNPDVYGLPYLKEQEELRTNSKIPASDRAYAFTGISEVLQERAADIFKPGNFESLSQTQEYSRTVRTFAINTAEWDAKFLLSDTSFSAFTQQHLPLSDEELATAQTAANDTCDAADGGGTGRRETNATRPRAARGGGGMPATTRRGRADDSNGDIFQSDPSVSTGRCSPAAASGALSVAAPTVYESYIDEPKCANLSAPIVRWAPQALRVGPAEARHYQEDVFGIFDNAMFFQIPVMSMSSADPSAPGETTQPSSIPGSPRSTGMQSTERPLMNGSATSPLGKTAQTSKSRYGSGAATMAGVSLTSDHGAAAAVDVQDVEVDVRSPLAPDPEHDPHGRGEKNATDRLQSSPNGGTNGITATAYDSCVSEAGSAGRMRRDDSTQPSTPPRDRHGDDARTLAPGVEVTPRRAAQRKIEERSRRREPPWKLQNRVKDLKPLDCVFRQDSRQARSGAVGQSQQQRDASANSRVAHHNRSPYGSITGDAGAESNNINNGNKAADNNQEVSGADDPFVFLNLEEERLNIISGLLRPYDSVFQRHKRCHIVQQVSEHCPTMVREMTNVARSLLFVLSKMAIGKTLQEGLCEEPVDFPFFRSKLLTTSGIVIKDIDFNLDKCFAEMDAKDDSLVRVKIRVNTLELEPIQFSYIDEGKAAILTRRANEQRKRLDRRRNTIGKVGDVYEKGYTHGSLKVKLKDISFTARGAATVMISGSASVEVEEASLKVGTMSLSSDLTRLNVLLTVGKPVIKPIIIGIIEDAIGGRIHK